MTKQPVVTHVEARESKLPFFIAVGVLATLAGIYFLIPSFKEWVNEAVEILTSKDKDLIRDWVAEFGMAGPIVLVLVMVVQMFLIVIPNILVMIIAITAYGPIWGSVISLTGVFASSSFGYAIGRYLGPGVVRKLISPKAQDTIAKYLKLYGVPAIIITRLASISNDALGIVAGFLRMRYKRFILATMAGITPLVVLLAIFGNGGRIERALLWIAGFSVVALIIYIIIRNKHIKQKQSGQ
ncbi:VTT domain-containing protein [Chitinophaga sedimenti]|uniref:TVP38/TMEM64 family protein n=1 Tax=Chitinophaga sedimenti TaxID=2033606 RepID=UPI002005E63C|nr:VTT domain-containing protein [Chitinophaga sedimenti]MCK7556020.1 VTT domain-containing protein [Chitinophaga sedimenti]